MKRNILLALLCCISLAHAQQPPPPPGAEPPGDPRPPGGDRASRAFFPPELVMRNQKAIGLTGSQQSAIREEMQKAMPRFTELQWQLSAEEESLAGLVNPATNTDEKAILDQFDKLMLVESELKRVRFALLVRLRSILTPDQQQKLEELKRLQRPGYPGQRPPPPPDQGPTE